MHSNNSRIDAQQIVKMIQGIYIELDPHGIIVAFESFLGHEIGITAENLCGKNWSDVFAPMETGKTGQQRSEIPIFEDSDQKDLYKLQTKTGDPLFIEWCFESFRNSSNDIISVLGVGQDVSSRVICEDVLQQRHLDLLEKNRILTCRYRIAQMVVDESHSFDATLQNIINLIPHAFENPGNMAAVVRYDDKSYQTTGFNASQDRYGKEITIKGDVRGCLEIGRLEIGENTHNDKTIYSAEEQKLLESAARKVAYIIDRKEANERKEALEEQLRHADRLATIGQLAAGIAHELNNPLSDILGFAQLAINYPDLPEQIYQDLTKIVKSTLYAREVIKKILLFGRQSLPHEGKVNLNRLIEDWVDFFEFRCKQNDIRIELKMDPDLPSITGDPSQLNQVLINLVVNAIHAMPEGGTLTIRTVIDPDGISMRVQDTGLGIHGDIKDKIFLPFFTTKEVDQGTGLGLSVVYGIINEHGGTVTVDSQVGMGSTFEIKLPF